MVGDPEHKSGLACNVDSQGVSSTKDANGIEIYKGGVPDAWVSRTFDICAFVSGIGIRIGRSVDSSRRR